MSQYKLDIDDVGEAGSFGRTGGSNLIRVTSSYRPDLVAIIFQAILNEDNDGAPDCYGKAHPPALDPLAYGTSDENAVFNPAGNSWEWRGLVSLTEQEAKDAGVRPRLDVRPEVKDRNGRFPLQQPAPSDQFYVSRTSTFANPGLPVTNQAAFWN